MDSSVKDLAKASSESSKWWAIENSLLRHAGDGMRLVHLQRDQNNVPSRNELTLSQPLESKSPIRIVHFPLSGFEVLR